MMYACNKNIYPGVDNYMPLIHCVDDTLVKMFPKGLPEGTVNLTLATTIVTECSHTVGHDYAKLDACAKGPDGIKYIGAEKAKTPGHKGVPFWIIGEGTTITYPNATNKENLVAAVCNAYTGSPKPAACSSASNSISPLAEGSEISFGSLSCEAQTAAGIIVL